jgi:hypothetical protein
MVWRTIAFRPPGSGSLGRSRRPPRFAFTVAGEKIGRSEPIAGSDGMEVASRMQPERPTTQVTDVVTWGTFAKAEPELAAFGAGLLNASPAYIATVRADGSPRVHPFTPIVTDDGLFVFMEPTSPKGHDVRERGFFAVHTGVPDMKGTGGEFAVSGRGLPVVDPEVRETVRQAAPYEPADRYVLFELRLRDARCNGYGDVVLPEHRRWVAVEG